MYDARKSAESEDLKVLILYRGRLSNDKACILLLLLRGDVDKSLALQEDKESQV